MFFGKGQESNRGNEVATRRLLPGRLSSSNHYSQPLNEGNTSHALC